MNAPDCRDIGRWLVGLVSKDKSAALQYINADVREVNDKAAAFLIGVNGRYYTVAVARMSEDFKP